MKQFRHAIYGLSLMVALATSGQAMNKEDNVIISFFSSLMTSGNKEVKSSELTLLPKTDLQILKEEQELLKEERKRYSKLMNKKVKNNGLMISYPGWPTIQLPSKQIEQTLNLFNLESPIKALELRNVGLDDNAAALIASFITSNKSLTELSVYINNIGNAGITLIMEAMQKNTSITWLNIGWNLFDDSASPSIATMLKTNKTLKSLGLDGANFGDIGSLNMANAIINNPSLTSIDLSCFQKGNLSSFINLTAALKKNTNLLSVRLAEWSVAPFGQTYVGDMLLNNNTLAELDLSGTTVGGPGNAIAPITEALKVNSGLHKLILNDNLFDDKSAQYLGDMLSRNKGLVILNLTNNKLTDVGANLIANGLGPNNTLWLLYMTNNQVSPPGRIALNDLGNSVNRQYMPQTYWLYVNAFDPQTPPVGN